MQLMDDNLIVSWNSSTNAQRMLDSSVRPRKGGAVMTRKSHGDRVDKVPKNHHTAATSVRQSSQFSFMPNADNRIETCCLTTDCRWET